MGVDKDVDGGGGAKILCVFGELWKIGKFKGEGVKSGYRTKGLFTWTGPLCKDLGTIVKRNKNQLCDYMTTEPARLDGIPIL